MLVFMELCTPVNYAYDFGDNENSEVVESVVEEVIDEEVVDNSDA